MLGDSPSMPLTALVVVPVVMFIVATDTFDRLILMPPELIIFTWDADIAMTELGVVPLVIFKLVAPHRGATLPDAV
jgi:hypothetical protein